MSTDDFPKATSADVALLLEGTFPYVSGGVSSWVNQIIRAFPDIRFAIVFLGSRRSDYGAPKYAIPANVVHLETHFLHDDIVKVEPHAKPTPRKGDAGAYADVAKLHDGFKGNPGGLEAFARIARELQPGGRLTVDDFLHSEASWDMIAERYRHYCTDPSFVDYFWTVRIMHQPLWLLGKVARDLIPVKAVHSISTGYAGFLGALIARSRGIPLVLSEHGIYTKERKIDLYQNEWIRDNRNVFQKDPADLSYFRQMWIRFFEWLGRLTYDAADPIIALYEANRLRQVADGALAERTFCIPNGISLTRLSPLRELQPDSPPPVLCLIGRVVPIKDIKTFIRAMRRVVNLMPEAEGWIAGPEDEDPGYAEECRNLAESLDLSDRSSFWASSASTRFCPRWARSFCRRSPRPCPWWCWRATPPACRRSPPTWARAASSSTASGPTTKPSAPPAAWWASPTRRRWPTPPSSSSATLMPGAPPAPPASPGSSATTPTR